MHPKETIIDSINSKGQIIISDVANKLRLEDQDKVAVTVYNDHIEIYPISFSDDFTDLKILAEESLSKVWDTPEEDAAWAHLRED